MHASVATGMGRPRRTLHHGIVRGSRSRCASPVARVCPPISLETMPTTVYVVVADPAERTWIEAALASTVDAVEFMDDGSLLLARLPPCEDACLVASAEPDERATLRLVRDLRARGFDLPVVVLGSHAAFRTAVHIARLAATDFLERPVSARQLRAAVRAALKAGA
jgi:FixJ family two-component response regulator